MRVVVAFLLLLLPYSTEETYIFVTGIPRQGIPKCHCTNLELTVIGNVRALNPDGAGVPGVPVLVNGNQKATTDNEGFYSIDVKNTGRIPIRFEAEKPFTPVVKILNIPSDYRGEVRFDVVLVKGKYITIDATQPNAIDIPLGSAAPGVTFDIPASTFLNPRTGQLVDHVVATLTAWSPDSDDDAETVPGDFCTLDDEGNKQGLFSQGVFCLNFRDKSGNDVSIREGCDVKMLKANPYTEELGAPILWGLNTVSGLWEFEAPFVSNGQFFEARVQPNNTFSDRNIDYPFEMCYMKVQAYLTDNFVTQQAGVSVHITQFIEGIGAWVFSNSAVTGNDGLCMRVLCCRSPTRCANLSLRGHITAQKNGLQYTAANLLENDFPPALDSLLGYNVLGDDVTIDSKIIERGEGPVYPSIGRCQAGSNRYSFYRRKDLDIAAGPQ